MPVFFGQKEKSDDPDIALNEGNSGFGEGANDLFLGKILIASIRISKKINISLKLMNICSFQNLKRKNSMTQNMLVR